MVAKAAAGTGTSAPARREGYRVCDIDIHEMVPRGDALVPYLDERWHHFGPPPPIIGTTLYNQVQGAVRDDALPHVHGYPPGLPGSNYELLCEQLLDPFDHELAVLTGFFHVSGMRSQFEYWQALAAAYNGWLADYWLTKDDRIHASIQVAFQEPEAAAAEIEKWGTHPKVLQVMTPVITTETLGQRRFRPMVEAAARYDMPLAFHFGWQTATATGDPPYYCELHVGLNQGYMAQLASLILSGAFDEFPNLRVVLLEGVWSWLPSFMWQLDHSYELFRAEGRKLERKPSDYVRDHVWMSTQPMPEPPNTDYLLRIIDMVGHDEWLCFSSDYPHWDFDPPSVIPRSWPEDLRRKILRDNALGLYARRLERVGKAPAARAGG